MNDRVKPPPEFSAAPAPLPDWSALLAERDATIERLRAALDILQAAMTAKKPIPLPFKQAIMEARAALAQEPRT